MEMEYTDRHSRRSKVYIAVGVIASLLVAAVVFVALRFAGMTQEAAPEVREVVVAAAEIPARKTIEETDLQIRTLPADPTNASAFTSTEEVVGRIASVPISLGQIVGPNLLASSVAGQEFSILEPGVTFDPDGPDWRAVSLTVPDDRAVGGVLQPGQQVDLIVTLNVNPLVGQDPEAAAQIEFVAGPSTKVTLQTVTILSRTGGLYIIRTDLATAEKIAELQAVGGQFSFALRLPEDDRAAETEGSTVDMLLKEFDFPVPRAAPLGVEIPPQEPPEPEDSEDGTEGDQADEGDGETP